MVERGQIDGISLARERDKEVGDEEERQREEDRDGKTGSAG